MSRCDTTPKLKYVSLCSGIEAATVAWHHIGWQPLWYSEIDPFCNALLEHYYPSVPNIGDMNHADKNPIYHQNKGNADVLIGGTPCQSFSHSGRRAGLDDSRGQLALKYVEILSEYKPKWFIWENVPGVLDSNGGKDFQRFLHEIAEYGYGLCWRVLDSRYFGVPQARRRVFVVGSIGDWRPSAAVLLERDSHKHAYRKRSQTWEENPPLVARTILTGFDKRTVDEVNYIPSTREDGSKSIRPLTPLERERCFGLPDNYTLISYKGKPARPTPRCKTIGNTIAVNVLVWLGNRIRKVEGILRQ